MILDTSAVLAVVFGEEGFEGLAGAISAAASRRISAASFLESSIVAESRGGDRAVRQVDSFFRTGKVVVEPFTEEQAFLARQAYSDYGKGRHPAGLNFGDCFSYALAKATGEPLLFKGDDLRKTDVKCAIP